MKGMTRTMNDTAALKLETATFGAGCFWGIEETFRQVPGVHSTVVGYLGGTLENPTYADVCTGRTGHAEVVQVTFDSEQASYDDLLDVFWESHNPRTRNRQGFDIGTQYRSAIFFHTPEQEARAHRSKDDRQPTSRFKGKIVTEITPASAFFRAEDYHQRYLAKRGAKECRV